MKIYKDILDGNVSLFDAKKKLGQQSCSGEFEVYVTPDIVAVFLEKYMKNELTADQLSEWADFLISSDVYVTEGWEDDEQADNFLPMWNVLQQLATPFIDGPITKERISYYLKQLKNIDFKK